MKPRRLALKTYDPVPANLAAPSRYPHLTLQDEVDLASFDCIVLNTSAGKDSQVMMDVVTTLAEKLGLKHKLLAVHCDLGEVEWPGTVELAREHCEFFELPLYFVKNEQRTFLEYIEWRKFFPGPGPRERWCTSDFKTHQVYRLHTAIAKEVRRNWGIARPRILDVLGIRAEESSPRADMCPYELSTHGSSSQKEVWRWFPIFDWKERHVKHRIAETGVPYHQAYDLGMPRLSCSFCIYANREALLRAGELRPELLAKYVAIERRLHRQYGDEKHARLFQKGKPIESIQKALAAGERAGKVPNWQM
jgi:3'-phosphoadenosine 5'-phosphosulfate sulfotransferase (PAPS reductase)/FAD synthetase